MIIVISYFTRYMLKAASLTSLNDWEFCKHKTRMQILWKYVGGEFGTLIHLPLRLRNHFSSAALSMKPSLR